MLAAFHFALLLQTARKHRVVFDVTSGSQVAWTSVLGNVDHVKAAFAPDPVEFELVCHGEGISMLLTGGKLEMRMAEAAKAGVVFAACSNTMKGRHLTRKDIYRFCKVVDAGTAELIRKQEAGWSYIKPG